MYMYHSVWHNSLRNTAALDCGYSPQLGFFRHAQLWNGKITYGLESYLEEYLLPTTISMVIIYSVYINNSFISSIFEY
jgi:hypothetical protein